MESSGDGLNPGRKSLPQHCEYKYLLHLQVNYVTVQSTSDIALDRDIPASHCAGFRASLRWTTFRHMQIIAPPTFRKGSHMAPDEISMIYPIYQHPVRNAGQLLLYAPQVADGVPLGGRLRRRQGRRRPRHPPSLPPGVLVSHATGDSIGVTNENQRGFLFVRQVQRQLR